MLGWTHEGFLRLFRSGPCRLECVLVAQTQASSLRVGFLGLVDQNFEATCLVSEFLSLISIFNFYL